MAITFQTEDALLVIPGAYAKYTVQQNNSGLSTTGVLALIGEATKGPHFSLEENLQENFFGADQLGDVVAKYGSGPLVDAFRASVVPSLDPDITTSPSGYILIKTNDSDKASSNLTATDLSTYGTLYDKSYGELGNLIYYTATAETSEVKPTTGLFTFLFAQNGYTITLRANGGVAQSVSITSLMTPASFASTVDGLTGIDGTGGADRSLLTAPDIGELVTVGVSGNDVTITNGSGTWTNTPSVGDTLYIPSGSAFEGAGNENRGSYVVTSATTSVIGATKLIDDAGVVGTLTPPIAVASTAIVAATDIQAWAPVAITLTGSTVIDGIGKTLEINEVTVGGLTSLAYDLSTTPVDWISKTGAPAILESTSEYSVSLNVNRQFDNIQEELVAGGQVALELGYTGTTATVTVTSTTLSTSRTGGTGADLTINLSQFPTLNDLASYINAQTGYQARVGSSAVGQLPPSTLDKVSAQGICTTFGNYTGLVKNDAYKFGKVVNENSVLVQLGNPAAAASKGLPVVVSNNTYLSGGTLGATTSTGFQDAVDALESVKCNFVVPLFSRDASEDIVDGLTDSGSSYTIDGVHAAIKTHCQKMSTLKKRRNRQGFVSRKDTFTNDKDSANNVAFFRVNHTFQDVRALSSGGVAQFQPWMNSAFAAAMQAAGFYKPMFNKVLNINGAIQAAGDFKYDNDSHLEDALLNGLLTIKRREDGAFVYVADNTTYTTDSNFVFNSIQAIYLADTASLTAAERAERAFVGKSVAEISASLVATFFKGIMQDFMRLRIIAPSDDAPAGFKNLVIRIQGNVILVSATLKLATGIYFVPISFLIEPVSQTATG